MISGLGCFVCICLEEDIVFVIYLVFNENVVIVSFGDMFCVFIDCVIDGCDLLIVVKNSGVDVCFILFV